jgi:phosphoglycerate kinase
MRFIREDLVAKQTVRDIDVRRKRVLVRVDFNVPLDSDGAITDDSRIRAVLPTIFYLLDNGATVLLCSHLGRPQGKVVEALRLAPVGKRLFEFLLSPVIYMRDCVGEGVERIVKRLVMGDVLLLENLRFHPEEGENDPEFAKALARLADVFVNDAFGVAHRAHASTVGVASYLPAVAGFLMEKELKALGSALNEPVRPLAAIIGGVKVSDKIGLLENILDKVDCLFIGGGMCCTFLKSQGYETGRSAVAEEDLALARRVMGKASQNGVPIFLPSDVVVAEDFAPDAPHEVVPIAEVPSDSYIMDIGFETIEGFGAELFQCKTIVWNGPMGVFEFPAFQTGTKALAKLLASLDAITVVGGGSSAEAVTALGLEKKMTHVSTGGGASLRFLEGRALPAVEVLPDKKS